MDLSEQPCWPTGRRCAVSITFDDALPVHHELAGPVLEARGMRGTFYLHIATSPSSAPMPWRALAARGHELGNHSLFHPCRRNADNRAWLDRAFDLRRYEPIRFQQEVRVANAFLGLIDGLDERTYAYTCYDTHLGRWPNKTAISDLIRSDFVAARGKRTDKPVIVSRDLDLMNLDCFQADGLSLASIIDAINITHDRRGWLILVFHGLGSGTHHLFVEPSTLNGLLDHFVARNEIWVAPVVEIAKWVRTACRGSPD